MATYIDALRGAHTACERQATGCSDRSRLRGDLTAEATQGYEAAPDTPCPHHQDSPCGMAWRVGQWLQSTGRARPRGVRMARGHSLHVNDMVVSLRGGAIERLR